MKAQQFLHNHGQTAEQVDVKRSLKIFTDKMHVGLNGRCQSIPMIPTYLADIDRTKIKPDVKRILIDAGGTNFRVAVGSFAGKGSLISET